MTEWEKWLIDHQKYTQQHKLNAWDAPSFRYTNYVSCSSFTAVQLTLSSNTFVEDAIISSQLVHQLRCTYTWLSRVTQH